MAELSASQIIAAIERMEVGAIRVAPDCVRVMREERYSLLAAVRSGQASQIAAAVREARRVASMWGVDLAA